MAWTYDDYIIETDAATKRARLALHVREVTAAISADTAADGKSRSSQGLITLRQQLMEELKALDAVLGHALTDPPASVLVSDLRGMRD